MNNYSALSPSNDQLVVNELKEFAKYVQVKFFTEGAKYGAIPIPKEVQAKLEFWYDSLDAHVEGMERCVDGKCSIFEVDDQGRVWFTKCDEAANLEFVVDKINGLLEPLGVCKVSSLLEMHLQMANSLPLEAKKQDFIVW